MRLNIFLILAVAAALGSGCAPPSAGPPPADATPGVNEANCLRSGGTVQGDACVCPEGFAADPAGFCLDASGKPGGGMGAAPAPAYPTSPTYRY